MVSYIVETLEDEAGDGVDYIDPEEDLKDWKYACR